MSNQTADSVPPDDGLPPNEEVKQNLKSRSTWVRLAFMLLFALIFYISMFVLYAVAVIQFLAKLLTGEANERLLRFGEGLSRFIYQTGQFLTFNTEEMPFPFSDWPSPDPD